MSLIDDIRKDRESGTPGPWRVEYDYEKLLIIGPREKCERDGRAEWVLFELDNSVFWDNPETRKADFSDASRVARVSEIETALLAADNLADAIAMSKPWEEIDAALVDYRKATEAKP